MSGTDTQDLGLEESRENVKKQRTFGQEERVYIFKPGANSVLHTKQGTHSYAV